METSRKKTEKKAETTDTEDSNGNEEDGDASRVADYCTVRLCVD
jgi:hypothetical protein